MACSAWRAISRCCCSSSFKRAYSCSCGLLALDFIAQFRQLLFRLFSILTGGSNVLVALLRSVLKRRVFQLLLRLLHQRGGLTHLRGFRRMHGFLHAIGQVREFVVGFGELFTGLGEFLAGVFREFFLTQHFGTAAIHLLPCLLDQLPRLLERFAGFRMGGKHFLTGKRLSPRIDADHNPLAGADSRATKVGRTRVFDPHAEFEHRRLRPAADENADFLMNADPARPVLRQSPTGAVLRPGGGRRHHFPVGLPTPPL